MLYKSFFDTHDEKPEWFETSSGAPFARRIVNNISFYDDMPPKNDSPAETSCG